MDFQWELETARAMVETRLRDFFPDEGLEEAMH